MGKKIKRSLGPRVLPSSSPSLHRLDDRFHLLALTLLNDVSRQTPHAVGSAWTVLFCSREMQMHLDWCYVGRAMVFPSPIDRRSRRAVWNMAPLETLIAEAQAEANLVSQRIPLLWDLSIGN